MNIFWYRRDLRTYDNHALHEALKAPGTVLPIFIFDKNILDQLDKDDSRVTFIASLLKDINTTLHKHQRSLAVFFDSPENVFKKLAKSHKIERVYTNHDYEPYAIKRDKQIASLLKEHDIAFSTFKDQVIFETNEVVKDNGHPYVVYTPYSRKWMEKLQKTGLPEYKIELTADKLEKHDYPFLDLKDIGFEASSITPEPFDISKSKIDNYEDTRNYPAIKGTSMLSPYLRFGAVSIREMVYNAQKSENITFLKELIWREFFMQILWHFPYTVNKAFKPEYDKIKWRYNETEFDKWCKGKTGYPIVDAGMRELNATGHMHNRVRMVVASFLCKHLLIDWRWGEAYFAKKLLDYEMSSNVGNWQWAVGSGVDAAPYFRVFNPTEQVKKFDKDLKYIRKWVPELETLAYKPMVEHKEARERALAVYKEGLNS